MPQSGVWHRTRDDLLKINQDRLEDEAQDGGSTRNGVWLSRGKQRVFKAYSVARAFCGAGDDDVCTCHSSLFTLSGTSVPGINTSLACA